MKYYSFKPTDDITAKEVAVILEKMMVAFIQAISQRGAFNPNDTLDLEEPIFKFLPEDVKKHFVEK